MKPKALAPLLAVLALCGTAGRSPGAAADAPDAPADWLRSVNGQRLKASWRLTVEMALSNDRGFRRDLVLDTRWAAWKDGTATLAVVTEPSSLRGTALLSREEVRPGAPDRSYVFLNTRDPKVTEVSEEARSEGLLGSDISHDDGQRLIDPSGYQLSLLEDAPCGQGRCARVVGVRRRPRQGAFDHDRAVWWIDRGRKEIAKLELRAAGRPLKTLEVTEWAEAGGVSIPRRQTMTHHQLGSRTSLTLRRFESVPSFPREDFAPERLPEIARSAVSRPAL
ncbi:MAG TPA: outer membrane lipoprotein-sorting protein [Thermoanaerobaculia bacterium]|nr:outer membrane lipoprotein-sorting protein [Thermoanaerobaculia bacterium]